MLTVLVGKIVAKICLKEQSLKSKPQNLIYNVDACQKHEWRQMNFSNAAQMLAHCPTSSVDTNQSVKNVHCTSISDYNKKSKSNANTVWGP